MSRWSSARSIPRGVGRSAGAVRSAGVFRSAGAVRSAVVVLSAVVGCAAAVEQPEAATVEPMAELARQRAIFELSCEEITLVAIGPMMTYMGLRRHEFGLAGCGKRIVYDVDCNQFGCMVRRAARSRGVVRSE